MKILIYSDLFGGNTTTFIYNEVIELSKKYEVKYVCIERKNPSLFPFKNLTQIPYQVNKITKKIRWWWEIYDHKLIFKNKVFSSGLNQIVEDFKPDIIHCHFGYEALRFFDNLDEKYHKIPTVISFRGYDASQFLNRKTYVEKIRKLLNRKNVHCTFVCDFLRQNLLKSKIQIERYMILHSGTKVDFFKSKQLPKNKNEFIFLQISSFQPYKGHIYTIKAFKKAIPKLEKAKLKPKLILAGEGYLLEEIKNLVVDLGIEKYVEFIGWVNHQQALDLLNKCNVFVQHSVNENGSTEGIPNSLMEAMAMELPVLSTYHAGIPELVESGVNGFLVPEKDIDLFADKMLELTKWPSVIPNNRKKIMEQFEFSVHMNKLERNYSKILTKNVR
jgi:colanic acid/amylovoran biosynthesis glycosyltransferase